MIDPLLDTSRPRALVTGASMGIGAGFARALAARGDDLVLVARSAAALDALAAELTAKHGIRADVITADLSRMDAVDALLTELTARDIAIGTLINNAGFGSHGFFAELDAQYERDEISVNVAALVALSRELLPGMIARRSGGIINVASTAAFQPVPYMATYGATKAFVLSFSVALAQEVREHGVRVVALCPGQTTTNFFNGMEESRVGFARSVEQVVATGLSALARGKVIALDGPANFALAASVQFAPRTVVAKIAARMMRPSTLH
jgi:short-subunit dehydrogenase